MLLSKINDLFNEKVALHDFKKEVESEVSAYRKGLDKKGASVPILLSEDMRSIVIRRQDVRLLYDAYLKNKLDEWDLNYLVEGLLLSEKINFDNDSI
ncbi:MAG: hypothetical protein Q8937_16920 [Bacteroidota bacterium]|nr:hypothetical protein [Bacteroidota bacterium]